MVLINNRLQKSIVSGMACAVMDKVDLGKAVLKGVSRSFYISIRLLPRLMREPVSVGYLLARASDTIADTSNVPAGLRKECLALFYPALKNEDARKELMELIESRFLLFQDNKREELLLQRLGDVFGWYDTVREWAWVAIADVMKPILEGQQWDVEYFSIKKKKQVASDEDLDTYCYQVAGSVGEFWGIVGTQAYRRYSHLSPDKLAKLGARYGKGLQLVNILRDLPEDLKGGRCYLPNVDVDDEKALMRKAKEYRGKARKYLKDGLVYCSELRQKRTRIATALPAIIGLKTLDLMDEMDWEQWQQGVKINRKEIRKSIWQAIRL